MIIGLHLEIFCKGYGLMFCFSVGNYVKELIISTNHLNIVRLYGTNKQTGSQAAVSSLCVLF